jgi:hypothetical protein
MHPYNTSSDQNFHQPICFSVMAHILSSADGASIWKTEIRERVMKNLEDLLHDAQLDYLRRVSESRLTTVEARAKLFAEYNREIKMLRNTAEEEVEAEISRGERERNLGTTMSGDLDHAFVAEQFAILKAIRSQPTESHHVATGDYKKTHFRQGSSSRPLDAEPPRTTEFAALIHSSTLVHSDSESPAQRDARLAREKHAKQQADYRKRAEEIQERKRRERQEREEREWAGQLQFVETMSCSSASSNTTIASEQEKPDGNAQSMGEDEVINLMIFHDQQWTWISSLSHLQWSDFPWPCLSFAGPKRKEDLTPEAIGEYVHAQYNIHQDRTIVKEHLRNLIRRWHPDRFEIKYLSRIADLHERDTVRDGAGIVTRVLNDLLGKWNGQ